MRIVIAATMICTMIFVGCKNKQDTAADGPESSSEKSVVVTQGIPAQKPLPATGDTGSVAGTPVIPDVPKMPIHSESVERVEGWPERLGDTAWSIDGLQWIKRGPVTFQSGTVYVLEFWATWCGPCRVSIPHLTELQIAYKDKAVVVIGISKESEEKVRPFVEGQGDNMSYAVAIDSSSDVYNGYMRAFNRAGIPCSFLVDGNGKVVWVGHPMNGLDEALARVTSEQ